MLQRIQVFYSPEYVTLESFVETRFENEKYDNHCPSEGYLMKEETKQTELQAHIFKKCAKHTLLWITNVVSTIF